MQSPGSEFNRKPDPQHTADLGVRVGVEGARGRGGDQQEHSGLASAPGPGHLFFIIIIAAFVLALALLLLRWLFHSGSVLILMLK